MLLRKFSTMLRLEKISSLDLLKKPNAPRPAP
jgi:hypothetical protein